MSFFQQLVSNSPVYSFGRFMALVMTAFCLGWDTSNTVFAWKFNMLHMPGAPILPLWPDVATLAAQAVFCGTFYFATKGPETFLAAKSSDQKAGGQ